MPRPWRQTRATLASGRAVAAVRPTHPDVATWRPRPPTTSMLIHELGRSPPTASTTRPGSRRGTRSRRSSTRRTYDPARDTLLGLDAEGSVCRLRLAIHRIPSRDVRPARVPAWARCTPTPRRRGIGRRADAAGSTSARCRRSLERGRRRAPGDDHGAYAEEQARIPARHLAASDAGSAPTDRWFSIDGARPVGRFPISMRRRAIRGVPQTCVVSYGRPRGRTCAQARNDAFRDHWGSLPRPPSERWSQFVERAVPAARPLVARADRRASSWRPCPRHRERGRLGGPGLFERYIDLIGVMRDRAAGVSRRGHHRAAEAARDAGLEKAVLDVDTESPTGANSLYGASDSPASGRSHGLARQPSGAPVSARPVRRYPVGDARALVLGPASARRGLGILPRHERRPEEQSCPESTSAAVTARSGWARRAPRRAPGCRSTRSC